MSATAPVTVLTPAPSSAPTETRIAAAAETAPPTLPAPTLAARVSEEQPAGGRGAVRNLAVILILLLAGGGAVVALAGALLFGLWLRRRRM